MLYETNQPHYPNTNDLDDDHNPLPALFLLFIFCIAHAATFIFLTPQLLTHIADRMFLQRHRVRSPTFINRITFITHLSSICIFLSSSLLLLDTNIYRRSSVA
ncbi:hypothetical protein BKA65DRAFT_242016 [Rhexocercosporidium sp. MPI-PUGE-AT-0058]|nr:hypothetical protein BKA65DRAFT_242016 [Rhexocercosporidium sp. MPI-PUGE-AT-0058]